MRIKAFIVTCIAAMLFAVPAYADTVDGQEGQIRPDAVPAASELSLAGDERAADEQNPSQEEQAEPDEEEASDASQITAKEEAPLAAQDVSADYAATHENMFRIYNPHTGEHLYTSDFYETTVNAEIGWQYEGIGWVSPTGDSPVYRLYNPYSGDHHYTMDRNEYDTLAGIGWNQEGVGWFSDVADQIPVYRLFNPNEIVGTHHYTIDANEYQVLGTIGWIREGIAWYATRGETLPVPARYLTTAAWGETATYWIGADGNIAKSRLVTTTEGADYCFYADENGLPAQGQIEGDDGKRYLAASNGVVAPMINATVGIDAQSGLAKQLMGSVANNSVCLFLPSYASLSNATLSAVSVDGVATNAYLSGHGISTNVGTNTPVDLSGLAGMLDGAGQVSLAMRYRDTDYVFTIMKSANIDALYVTSVDAQNQGRAYVEASKDHSVKANVNVTLVNAGGVDLYNADSSAKHSTIKGRGNSTWAFGIKKPYQISLSKKWDLLSGSNSGDNAQKKWILLANENDATMLHTPIGYDMGLELGLAGMQGKPVDLFYDGEYRGTYYLCEKVEIKSGRVDINDLEGDIEKANPGVDLDDLPTAQAKNSFGYAYQYVQGVKDPEDITGGYLLEIDGAYYSKEKCWFDTSVGVFVVKSPEVCSQNSLVYISEYVQTALNNLSRDIFNKGASFDLDSLAKTYLVSEFMKNIDAFCSSTYFYKDKDIKLDPSSGSGSQIGPVKTREYTPLIAAPLWDFDAAMGVRTDWPNNDFRKYEGFTSPHASWVVKSATVMNKARDLYTTTVEKLMNNVVLAGEGAVGANGYLHSLTFYRNQIARSQAMNQAAFGLSSFANELEPFATYDANVRYLKNWLTYRTQWFSANIAKLTPSMHNPTSVYNGVDYSDVYDYYYYISVNPEVAAAFGNDEQATLAHFVNVGMAQGQVASRNFDVHVYMNMYEDLRNAFGSDLAAYYRHFVDYGFKEGRYIV